MTVCFIARDEFALLLAKKGRALHTFLRRLIRLTRQSKRKAFMEKVRGNVCKLAGLILVLSIPVSAQNGKPGTGYDDLGHPNWIWTKKLQLKMAEDPVPPLIRESRNRLFNSPFGVPLIPHDPSSMASTGDGGADFWETLEPVPTGMSDAIVVATVQSFQPFLSADSAVVYSELTAAPHEIINDKQQVLVPGRMFIVLQRGGTLQFSNGKVVESVPFGGGNPIRVAIRYMLFLRYHREERAFTVIRSWDLSGSKPLEMDDDGHPHWYRQDALENQLSTEEELKVYVKAHLR